MSSKPGAIHSFGSAVKSTRAWPSAPLVACRTDYRLDWQRQGCLIAAAIEGLEVVLVQSRRPDGGLTLAKEERESVWCCDEDMQRRLVVSALAFDLLREPFCKIERMPSASDRASSGTARQSCY